jgi:hypothetical protein
MTMAFAAEPFGSDPVGAGTAAAPAILLIAGDSDADTARAAIDLAGARQIECLPWSATQRIGEQAVIDVILAEAAGVDAAQIDAMLPRIDTLAKALDARVVVTLDTVQIDAVTAHLFGPAVALLCEPSVADRALALGLAAARPDHLHDRLHEAESERLRKLNDEVARIAQTLARLTGRDDVLAGADRPGLVGDRRTSYGVAPAPPAMTPIDPADVRKAIRARRLREQFFPVALIEDPGWDMLLDLFAADLEQSSVSVSSLCIAAAVAPTTALRWIGKMSEAGLFERRPDPHDRRRAFMALTDRARAGMERYCQAVHNAGLAIA